MINVIASTELPATAPGLPTLSAEALPQANEAGAIVTSKCHWGHLNQYIYEIPAKNVANGHQKFPDDG